MAGKLVLTFRRADPQDPDRMIRERYDMVSVAEALGQAVLWINSLDMFATAVASVKGTDSLGWPVAWVVSRDEGAFGPIIAREGDDNG